MPIHYLRSAKLDIGSIIIPTFRLLRHYLLLNLISFLLFLLHFLYILGFDLIFIVFIVNIVSMVYELSRAL
jgi:hypothetical protein